MHILSIILLIFGILTLGFVVYRRHKIKKNKKIALLIAALVLLIGSGVSYVVNTNTTPNQNDQSKMSSSSNASTTDTTSKNDQSVDSTDSTSSSTNSSSESSSSDKSSDSSLSNSQSSQSSSSSFSQDDSINHDVNSPEQAVVEAFNNQVTTQVLDKRILIKPIDNALSDKLQQLLNQSLPAKDFDDIKNKLTTLSNKNPEYEFALNNGVISEPFFIIQNGKVSLDAINNN